MSDFDNELRGVLFKVPEDKQTAKGPLYRGECEIKGQKYRIAAWIQKSAKGRTYMSLSFTKDDGEYEKTKARKDSQAPLERDASGTRVSREREPGEEEEVDPNIPF